MEESSVLCGDHFIIYFPYYRCPYSTFRRTLHYNPRYHRDNIEMKKLFHSDRTKGLCFAENKVSIRHFTIREPFHQERLMYLIIVSIVSIEKLFHSDYSEAEWRNLQFYVVIISSYTSLIIDVPILLSEDLSIIILDIIGTTSR